MVIQLDRSYKISFKTEEDGAGANFSVLDGFYEVVRSYGWNELNASGIDLKASLLDHVGIVDGTALRTLQINWVNDVFFYCIGMDTDKQIWVPESIIKGYPDPRIGSYKKLMLTLDLGVFANADDFSTLGKDILNYLRNKFGIDRPDGIVSTYANQWMTVKEYEDTDIIRKSCQGLVYIDAQTIIPVGNHLNDPFTVVFDDAPAGARPANTLYLGKPVIAGVPSADICVGAISESIKLTYGNNFGDIPQGSADSENAAWYFLEDDLLENNTAIEKACDINFTSNVVKQIRIKTNFKKPFYAWQSSSEKLAFTQSNTPSVGDKVYSDKTLLNESGTITEVTANSITATFGTPAVSTVYNYFSDANQVILRVGYRCRHLKTKHPSAYTQSLKYAYENIRLKEKIAALETELTGKTYSNEN